MVTANTFRSGVLGLLSGLALTGGLLSGSMAGAQSVPAAEQAAQTLLPRGSRIVGSMLLSPDRAQVQIERDGQLNWVVMDRTADGQWQQNLQATMELAASELQAQAFPTSPVTGFGQTAPDTPRLLDSTRRAVNLLPAADPELETQRALSRAGRVDPFAPVDPVDTTPLLALPDTNLGNLPPLPPTPFPLPPLEVPTSTAAVPPPTPLPPPPVAAPTPDPAEFARSVRVTGLIQIDNESFALVNAPGSGSTVVQTGTRFESAEIRNVSPPSQEVTLQEGGETVIKTVGN